MELANFNEIFAVAVGINFAYILVRKGTNKAFHEILELGLQHSLERITKKSLQVLMPCQLVEDRLNFSGENKHPEISRVLSNIKKEVSDLIERKRCKGFKYISLSYHSHISLFLGLYALFLLFDIAFKFNINNNHINSLLLLNVCGFIFFNILFFSEFIALKWGFKLTIISTSVTFLLFFVPIFFKIPDIRNPFICNLNNYFTIIFPFTGFIFYSIKAVVGTEIIVIRFNYKIKQLHIQDKVNTLNSVLTEAEKAIEIPTIQDLNIKASN